MVPHSQTPHSREDKGRCEFAVQVRLLLYLSCLGLDDVAGLELAAECLRRTGPDADHRRAMQALRELLRERGLEFDCLGDAMHFHSFPPIRRKTMIAQPMGGLSLIGSAKRLARRLLRIPSRGSRPAERKRA